MNDWNIWQAQKSPIISRQCTYAHKEGEGGRVSEDYRAGFPRRHVIASNIIRSMSLCLEGKRK